MLTKTRNGCYRYTMPTESKKKPSILLRSGGLGRAKRLYLHEALAKVVDATTDPYSEIGLPWHKLDPVDAKELLPELRRNLSNFAGLVKTIEAIAEGKSAARCTECQARFYPLRSDASYCSGRCRTRACRKRSL